MWATLPLSIIDTNTDPLAAMFRNLRLEINDDVSAEEICGRHVYAAALDDEEVYNRAPRLSQVMATLVKSIKPAGGTTVTMYALMWTHWAFVKWMLAPSRETYAEIPEAARPTCWQLFTPHLLVCDFVSSPLLREHICQTGHFDMQWFTDACVTIAFDWSLQKSDALCRNQWTGELDLSPACKSDARKFRNWSLGAELRTYLPDADEFFRIRGDQNPSGEYGGDELTENDDKSDG